MEDFITHLLQGVLCLFFRNDSGVLEVCLIANHHEGKSLRRNYHALLDKMVLPLLNVIKRLLVRYVIN